jgi:hypothetical protein
MSGEQFTSILADRVLGWKVCPDRFIKSGRAWIPRSRFKPLARLDDAFLLLGIVARDYSLNCVRGKFTAEVRIGNRTGKATGDLKARTITLAIAQALGIEAPK